MTRVSVLIQTRRFASEQANRLLRRLAFQISQTSRSCNPTAVHDLRVAIRRFTQALIVFKPCFHGKEIRKIRRQLKRMMVQAGEVRNYDIALKLLSRSTVAAAAALAPKLQSQRKEAERDLTSVLKRWIDRKSSMKWRAALESALGHADPKLAAMAIESAGQQILPRRLKDFLKSGNAAANPNTGAEGLHAFRIATKKFRYTLEIFAPICGPQCQVSLVKLKRIQDLLGENNDLATVERMVSRVKGAETLTAWLQMKQRKTSEEFFRYWREEFRSPEQLRSLAASIKRARAKSPARKKPASSEAAPRVMKSSAAVA